MTPALLEYYRCPGLDVALMPLSSGISHLGYFRFGSDLICYGHSTSDDRELHPGGELRDIAPEVCVSDRQVLLPFDPEEIIENLLRERYTAHFREEGSVSNALIRKLYYLMRPYMGLSLRTRLQRIHLRNWDEIPFPSWPVDFTVDRLQQRLLGLMMRAAGVDRMPFIWFWPDGFKSCVIVTHDVEHTPGKEFCPRLMDIDESYGFKSSFQIVPEVRYPVERAFLETIRDRGFEVNVHDLKHDGRLYAEHGEFQRRAQRINQYARDFGAEGFRSGILYRNADWYDAFEFSYDMSLPNVGHLDPQRGGCCTVMPYFIGNIVELPLTCTQDHTMFNILNEYSLCLWKRQIDLIQRNHGLITILAHPDYVIESRAQTVYRNLLDYMRLRCSESAIWSPLPRDVAAWWRHRSQMRLVQQGDTWRIAGQGSERARVAYAYLHDGAVTYGLEQSVEARSH